MTARTPGPFYVDGTDGDTLRGGVRCPPYAVFDANKQDWVLTGICCYWVARLIVWFLQRTNGGDAPCWQRARQAVRKAGRKP